MRFALAGNPNCGKTTLFNALTGSNQRVGNWPGVTVEKKEGACKANKEYQIVDLPGIYSLSPYTLEEVVARKFIIDERPDAIINIIDGSNLERNLLSLLLCPLLLQLWFLWAWRPSWLWSLLFLPLSAVWESPLLHMNLSSYTFPSCAVAMRL